MQFSTRGSGRPLVLFHGLGGSSRSWEPVLGELAAARQVIALDLPGFGASAALTRPTTIGSLADAVVKFLQAQGLEGVDAVGSSMGAQLALELARRGKMGAIVALNPSGFWRGWERYAFYASMVASVRSLRALRPVIPFLTEHGATRAPLLAQLSAHPARLSRKLVLEELRGYAASPVFEQLLSELAFGEEQEGARAGSIRAPVVIGWGRRDRICLPRQAARALELFPDARLHWFEDCGHLPHWDCPRETVELILEATRPPAQERAPSVPKPTAPLPSAKRRRASRRVDLGPHFRLL